MNADLFADAAAVGPADAAAARVLEPGAVLLPRYACPESARLIAAIDAIAALAPFRHFATRSGASMSAAMTNCGAWGWTSDRRGYRYDACDPTSGRPWPAMPGVFRGLAGAAAAAAGFDAFDPDACLINRYRVGARMGLHQDRDECDHAHPIVSVSLGCPVLFQLGGFRRSAPTQRVLLEHGDVLVFGGPSRLRYHGVLTLKPAQHVKLGAQRINLTFRRAR